MNYSNKLKLDDIISKLKIDYVIIKKPSFFPNYFDFSDIDILIKKDDINQIIKTITQELNNYNGSYKIINTNGHLQIDYYDKNHNKLNFKFDFLYDLNYYKKSKFINNFINIVLKNRIKNGNIYIPKIEHELIIRWVEYIEYVNIRPDKIKHLNYIKKFNININNLKKIYLL